MMYFLKRLVEPIPYFLGSKLALIPFSLRLGRVYTQFKNEMELPVSVETKYVIDHFSMIFEYAKNTFPFYKELYQNSGITDLKIQTLRDIERVPVITKEVMRKHLSEFKGAMLLNTGGSSGEPFSFFVDKNAFAREWGHMHCIWSLKGYKYTDLKITLMGKDLHNTNIKYNPVHNEFILNTYKNAASYKYEIIKLFKKRVIKYIHGYPSAIFNFLKELEPILTSDEKIIIQRNLKACLLSSEYPMSHITDYLKSTWNLDFISWYGHSEMCILAYEEQKANIYKPFHTYGYAEAVNNKLIGTSFHNYDMPLIRYDTGDIVEPTYTNNGLLSHFTITQGRNGDYIIDKNNKKIPLTALIFGRHHEVFNFAQFVQVRQTLPGEVIFFITTTETNLQKINNSLNLKNVSIDYKVQIVSNPFKTLEGKVLLKI